MIKRFILFSFLVLFISANVTSASAQYEIKDSYYFMKDDGIFSDEEKDEEAMYIFDKCQKDNYKSIYFDCQCIAGTFRRERDKEKLLPQHYIIDKIYNNKDTECINSPEVAASSYKFCQDTIPLIRARESKEDNEKFCECVANDVAKSFGKHPLLNTRYIEKIRASAFRTCG